MEYTPTTFVLPDIEGLSKEQLALHIGLYEGYVKHVNLLMSQMAKLAGHGDDFAYTIAEVRRRLGFEWNGMHLHELYFEALVGGSQVLLADTELYKQLTNQYGSFMNIQICRTFGKETFCSHLNSKYIFCKGDSV